MSLGGKLLWRKVVYNVVANVCFGILGLIGRLGGGE